LKRTFLLTVFGAAVLGAQGTAPEWDIRSNMSTLVADVRKLDPLLAHVKPQDWVAEGAPQAYVQQLESSKSLLQHLVYATDALAQNPDRLTTALSAFFHFEKMELLLGSLNQGVRKYQSPDLADMITSQLARHSVHRERLRQHITDLATVREQEFELLDQEAQRCRASAAREGRRK
jgi:hypothetical protein